MFVSKSSPFLLLYFVLAISGASAQEYEYGQATWYDSILNGFCGFGSNIPSNGFVAAWPFIETGPNGQGSPQPGGGSCGTCLEVSCVPQFVESADGQIYLDRRDACADPNRAVVVRVVDECRCSLPRDSNLPKGNFNWCCNTPTPKMRINRHIDLSQQAFTALVKGGDYGRGIIGIRYRLTSCSRIGIVRVDTGAPVPITNVDTGAPVPITNATTGKANAVPAKPTPPPKSLQKQPARENTQELPLISQCGGTGGDCAKYGPGNLCRDKPFTGYTCARGLNCERQNHFYWQCVRPDKNNIDDGTYAVSAAQGNTAKTTSNGPKPLAELDQCGGKGGKCGDYGACVDKLFPGYACSKGLSCVRQNQYYYQCLKDTFKANSSSNNGAKPQGDSGSVAEQMSTTCKVSPAPQAPSKVQGQGQQCGGTGGDCKALGGCVNGPIPGLACAPGLTCKQQNQYFWECKA